MAAGTQHSLLLRSDGVVKAFGLNLDGQTDVPTLPPPGMRAGHDPMNLEDMRPFHQMGKDVKGPRGTIPLRIFKVQNAETSSSCAI